MDDRELSPEERALIDALRRANRADEPKLPLVDDVELRRLLKARVGLSPLVLRQTMTRLGLVTMRHDGPRVILNGTLSDLKLSWEAHHDDLVNKGASGAVLKHRREAVERYCRALKIPWSPEASVFELRSLKGRATANAVMELPEDFLDRIDAVVRAVEYHEDPAMQAMYQTRARVNFKTGPRTPSEDARLRLGDVHALRNVVVYRQSKIGGPEQAILVAREVFDVPENVTSSPVHMSLSNFARGAREVLLRRLVAREGETARHDFMYPGPRGTPMSAEKFRFVWGALAKSAWPGFYPYLSREIAIIMRGLVMIFEDDGVLDLERLMQWSGHTEVSTLRTYTRKARSLYREARTRSDLKELIRRWNEI